MATWTFSGYSSGRGADVTVSYSASYNQSTNQTTVTITSISAAFNTGGTSGYCALAGTLTVKATDNSGSYGTVTVDQSKNGSYPTVDKDYNQTIIVSHGVGTSKKITLSFTGRISSVTYLTDLADTNSGGLTIASATARSLSVSAGSGAEISVSRQSSPWAAAGSLLSGDAVYDGDVLVIGFSAMTGYALTAHTVNGSNFTSGGSHTVSANVTISAAAELLTYTLTIDADSHAAVAVTRGGEALNSGAAINHFDVLSVTVSAKAGYKVSAADINGTDISPDAAVSHTVSGPVTVTAITEALSNLLLDVGGVRKRFLILIDSGGVRKNFRAIFK